MLEDIIHRQYPTSHADMNSIKGTTVYTKIKAHHEDTISDAQHQTYISTTYLPIQSHEKNKDARRKARFKQS
jgi:hypothetical protein